MATEFIIQSNESSVILRDLDSKPKVNLSYSVKPSYPVLSKKWGSIPSENTISTPAGSTVIFKLPRAGILSNLQIQSVMTATATSNSLTTPMGLNLFEEITIRTNNKILVTLSDAAIKSLAQHAPLSRSVADYRRAYVMDTTSYAIGTTNSWTNATATVFTPIFAYLFDNIQQNVDLSFWEPISVHCKVNSQARAGLTNALTAMTCTLWYQYWLPDAAYLNKLKAQNMTPGAPLSILGWSTFLEKFTCTSTTQNIMRLNANVPVTAMYFFVKHISTGAHFLIDSFDFSIAGQKYMDAVPWIVADYEVERLGSVGIIPTTATAVAHVADLDRVRCMNFCMDPYDRSYNSGAMSFNNLLTPTLTVNTQTLTTASNYEIHVVYLYHDVVAYDPSNGQIAVATST